MFNFKKHRTYFLFFEGVLHTTGLDLLGHKSRDTASQKWIITPFASIGRSL